MKVVKTIFVILIVIITILLLKYPAECKNYVFEQYHKLINDEEIVIPLETDSSDVFYVTVKLNSVPMKFILDTGCSTMQISKADAEFLLHHEILDEKNISDSIKTICANGTVENNNTIIINELEIGNMKLKNIKTIVSNSNDTPLLIGQSVLSNFSEIKINYKNKTLTLIK